LESSNIYQSTGTDRDIQTLGTGNVQNRQRYITEVELADVKEYFELYSNIRIVLVSVTPWCIKHTLKSIQTYVKEMVHK
jgi:hypothetical protein